MRTSRHPGMVSKPEKNTEFWPNSVIRVRREKVMVHSGSQTRPGTGSLHPVAIRAAVEATRPLKPLVQKVVKATR
jgi:hypothetical protein